MIQKEFYKTRKDGVNLYRTYSDSGMDLKQVETGIVYGGEVVDVESAAYTYEEVEPEEDAEDIPADEALNILLGGEQN